MHILLIFLGNIRFNRCTRRRSRPQKPCKLGKVGEISKQREDKDVVVQMDEDSLPKLPSAPGTQLEVGPEGVRSARVEQHADVGSPFSVWLGKAGESRLTPSDSSLIFCRSRRLSERLPSPTTVDAWLTMYHEI